MSANYYSVAKENEFTNFIHKLRTIISRECNTDYWRFKVDGVPFYENGYADLDINFYGIGSNRDGDRSEMTDLIGELFVSVLGEEALDYPESDEPRCIAPEYEDGSRPFAHTRTLDELVNPCADYIARKIKEAGF